MGIKLCTLNYSFFKRNLEEAKGDFFFDLRLICAFNVAGFIIYFCISIARILIALSTVILNKLDYFKITLSGPPS